MVPVVPVPPDRTRQPAIALLVCAGLNAGFWVLYGLIAVVMIAFGDITRTSDPAEAIISGTAVTVVPMIGIAHSALIAWGARSMLRRESWAWAMAAAVLALFQSLPCCLCPFNLFFELPIAIWAIVVLKDSNFHA